MRTNPYRFHAIFSLWVLSVLLVLCPASAENIKIGIPSLTVTMLPVAVAKEQGFFQKEGLSAELDTTMSIIERGQNDEEEFRGQYA